jgi:hypothetical protein
MYFGRHRRRPAAGRPGLLGLLQRRAYLPVLLLVPALAVGLGLLVPRATSSAATIVESAEVGDFLFEKSDENLLGITDRARGLRLELDLDTAPGDAGEEQLDALKTEVAAAVKDIYGWDLNDSADRARIRDEILLLRQALHTIPDETINLEGNGPLLALRDVADGIEGISDCRGRCLPEGEVMNRMISVAVGATVNRMLGEFTGDSAMATIVVYAVSVFVGGIAEFTFNVGPALTGIPVETLRKSALAGAVSTLILVKSFLDDARALADKNAGTVQDATKQAAESVKASANSEVDTKDYDMIKDEL